MRRGGSHRRQGRPRFVDRRLQKYQEILSGPPVTLVAESRESAARRLEEIRNGIALAEVELGARDEKNGDWRAALERYQMVAEKFGFHRDPITSKIARAQKQLDDCAVQVQAGREAFQASKWDAAYHAAVAALDLVSADPDARSLLTSIAPKLQPPPGMVLVPPGKYIVGGSEGNPRRTVELPFGVFIDVKEVTRGRYRGIPARDGAAGAAGLGGAAGQRGNARRERHMVGSRGVRRVGRLRVCPPRNNGSAPAADPRASSIPGATRGRRPTPCWDSAPRPSAAPRATAVPSAAWTWRAMSRSGRPRQCRTSPGPNLVWTSTSRVSIKPAR